MGWPLGRTAAAELRNRGRWPPPYAEAKEKVKQWYLDDPIRAEMLTEAFNESFLKYFFPRSDLEVQWSLSSCQGDGVNICGTLDLNDVLHYIEKWNPDEHSDQCVFDPTEEFTAKELKRLWFYRERSGRDAVLPQNWRYTYCLADQIDFADDMIDDLKWEEIRDIDEELINKFQYVVVEVIKSLCGEMERYGYDFLYEIDDAVLAEACEANGWTFTADGKFEVA